jgi:hypothetical protein
MNHIAQHMRHPCHITTGGVGTVNVIIETAVAAGIPALIAASAFSCMDIIKTRAGISWKCGRALKAVIDQAHGPKVTNAGKFAYEITGGALLERALWYYFIAELVTEFAANWTSLMYSVEGCGGAPSGTVSATAGPWDYGGGGSDERVLFGAAGNECCGVGGTTILILPGCNGNVSFSNSCGTCVNGLEQCSLQTSVIDTGGITYNSSNNYGPGGSPENNGTITMAQNLNGGAFGKEYAVKVVTDGDLSKCTQLKNGQLTISTQGHAIKPIPVGCTPKSVG